MLLTLSVKFRKHIAVFMFGIFYVQLTIAERLAVGSWQFAVGGWQPAWPVGRLPVSSLPAGQAGWQFPVTSNLESRLGRAGSETWNLEPRLGGAGSETGTRQPFNGGPTQPEMSSFQSVNSNNMVDLFSGDFSYNIPLLDVGGYPVNISYHSGISPDEEASWVGLGWNINPGSITRNMRGVPDDFNGGADTMKKVQHIKPNVSWGVNAGANVELAGLPLPVSFGGGLGIFHTTYTGWGFETSLNASINAGAKGHGPLSGGLSLTNNSQSGYTINPSLSVQTKRLDAENNGASFGFSLSAPMNSRTGLKSIQMGLNAQAMSRNNDKVRSASASDFAGLTFAWPTYNPSMSIPTTNYNFSFTAKFGTEAFTFHPNLYVSGYGGSEFIAKADTALLLPVFGYLNYQNIGNNWASLTDYNREKEMAYREKPAIPHIAVPSYTYDVFSVSGEGTGGTFRPYRGDIGFIADHLISSKTITGAASVDFGAGNLVHGGTDLNANYSVTTSGPWQSENALHKTIAFRNSQGLFEAAYFRNPGEKTINTTAFYDAIGGDDVVTPMLHQPGNSSPNIRATNKLLQFRGKKVVDTVTLTAASAVRNTRDKRSQVFTYLTAAEASVAGLSKYIERYDINQFKLRYCQDDATEDAAGEGTGLLGYYYKNATLAGSPAHVRLDKTVFFDWGKGQPFGNKNASDYDGTFPGNDFSVRWTGRLKAPVTGMYALGVWMDDGVRMWVNDSLVIDDWKIHGERWDTVRLNLVAGQLYNIKLEFFERGGKAYVQMSWRRPDQPLLPFTPQLQDTIPMKYLYPPKFSDTTYVNPILTREDRINNFRKSNHISEINVLNPDGRRYVYGTPVYNLLQKEVSFSINTGRGNLLTGLTGFNYGTDNTTKNNNGKDGYFSKEIIPPYAHSFLLNAILSPDYVDITGNGISDDDIGDAVKFNYSKASGVADPYQWRAPYIKDSANYNEGLKTYNRDDKAHYIYGQKELWYLHSIESKTMVANFILQPREDLLEIDEAGNKIKNYKAWCLKRIDLYSKADFMLLDTAATPIKTVNFEYSYELCRGVNRPLNDSGKLTLKKIWFTYNGNDKGKLNPYVFNYHNNNPQYGTNITDKWGTYKPPSQNPGYTTGNPINNAEYPYSLQDSTLAAYNAGAWMLDSIQLPSGGRIKVNYESDDYAYVQNRRATQMFKIAGYGTDTTGGYGDPLYIFDGALNSATKDRMYVYVKVPYAVGSRQELYARYLEGLEKIYFKIFVRMPPDLFGSGSEYVPCYARPDLAAGNWYGITDANTIWIKIAGVNKAGDGDGDLSPLAQAALNYLRINLPSKAYPGSEVSDDMGFVDGVKVIATQITNIVYLLNGFNKTARSLGWARKTDTSRSFVRLNNPTLKKYGGGLRVKSILIYDHWNAMTGKKETVYGQLYDYTTTKVINGDTAKISSGVASWEPVIGGDENPFHLPIEYIDRISVLAPSSSQYTEEPLGEAFFPGPSIGYSKVRMRTVHAKNTRSANGYTETTFFTTKDFPTTWDWSVLDNSTKKRYKPLLNNFLRINAKSYLTLSQGFKVELNDMNGKMRTEATYSETDHEHPISYTENFYRVDNQSVEVKHLYNVVATIDPYGNIDTAATIGKDVELMTDMRDQTSKSIGGNVNVNVDLFAAGIFPVVIPSLLGLYQSETNQFRSVAMTKVIQRYGILDSVVHIEKGSKISSKNLLYDSETGDPLLVRTQNEFNDPIYQFTYPAHWVYNGIGPAYQNINAVLRNLTVKAGKIISGLPLPDSAYLTAGDELLVYSKQTIDTINCVNGFASFPNDYKLWVIDTNVVQGGPQRLFLVDEFGTPFSGNDVTLKVIRSGRRNMNGAVGSVMSLANPLQKDEMGVYHLVFDSSTQVVNAGANEYRQYWEVEDKRRSDILTDCIITAEDSAAFAAEACNCMKPFFDYLIDSKRLFRHKIFGQSVNSLVNDAISAGYPINLSNCSVLSANLGKRFYALSTARTGSIYQARIGDVVVNLRSRSGLPVSFFDLTSSYCDSIGVVFKDTSLVVPEPDTVTVTFNPDFSVNLISGNGSCPLFLDTLLTVDSTSDRLLVENNLDISGAIRNAVSILRFDSLRNIPFGAEILSAQLVLQADHRGHYPPQWMNANSVNPIDTLSIALTAPAGWFPYQPLDTMLTQGYYSEWYRHVSNETPFQNDTFDMMDYLTAYLEGLYTSGTFMLTQGSGNLQGVFDTDTTGPGYLKTGYGNYYSTFYSTRYSDPSKWPAMKVTYIVPPPLVDTLGAVLEYNSTISCNTIVGKLCYSPVTDTTVNPYKYGLLGNFRPLRNYVYYGRRAESDPLQATNIRKDGTIENFAPFWTLQGTKWVPSYDTTRWVWNSQTTLFNRKGFELENKDPLGRYNAGLYGYGLTMPTAVIQNSRFREAAFDGFEDYGFTPNSCDTACPLARPFDFSAFSQQFTTDQAHTGLYSLGIEKDSTVSVTVALTPADDSSGLQLTGGSITDTCIGATLEGLRASNALLPSFSPIPGKRMVIGGWVKEDTVCLCKSYTRNHILVSFVEGENTTTLTLSPSGTLVEGWQRYEAVVDIPVNATQMTLTLEASDSSFTWFDDICIHPYNAQMKSYIYNPVNLRLMAELDERNYATLYEYDDDGTLIRLKKETERGLQTIKETRSALIKEQ